MQSVLAIDDSQDVHDLLRVRLKSEAVAVHHALDAEDGLRKAKEIQPDLVLLDVDMPRMTGFEVCKCLKRDPRTADVPVIFLTGAAAVYDKVAGFDIGAVDYITKPFDGAELRARVRAALRTKRYQDMLANHAHVDALTGLWNRWHFDQRLAEESAATRRYGRVVALVMIDLDDFKMLNDTHGHPMGDRILQAAGEAISSCVRKLDLPSRYGGEEFAVILTETRLAGAIVVAERIRRSIEALDLPVTGAQLRVTASLGVAASDSCAPGAQASDAALRSAADRALYAAKRAGKNRVWPRQA